MQKTNINMLKEGSILSESSHYIDLGIDGTNGDNSIRPVNTNTIEYLIFNGVKYIVE